MVRRYSLYAAGSNSHGQLGASHCDDLARWTRIPLPASTANVSNIACGANHSVVLSEGDKGQTTLLCAGSDARGQLSARSNSRLRLSFEPLDLNRLCERLPLTLPVEEYKVERVAAGWETTFIVLRPRSRASSVSDVIISFGANDWGERGCLQATKDSPSIVSLEHPLAGGHYGGTRVQVIDLIAGPRHALALVEVSTCDAAEGERPRLRRRALLGWGASRHGQLGDVAPSAKPARTTPTPREIHLPNTYTAANVTTLAAGRDHSGVVFRGQGGEDGVLLMGLNKHGQLGPSTSDTTPLPGPSLNTNLLNSKALCSSGGSGPGPRISTVQCTWSSTFLALSPAPSSPSSGGESTLLAFGLNSHGQLGAPYPAVMPSAPALRPALPPAYSLEELAAGSEHALALLRRDEEEKGVQEVWGWGWNEHGNLGYAPEENPGQGETTRVSPMDARTPRRVWPPFDQADSARNSAQKGHPGNRPVRVWAGMATSWILVEEQDGDKEDP